jgi:hypothetical protein
MNKPNGTTTPGQNIRQNIRQNTNAKNAKNLINSPSLTTKMSEIAKGAMNKASNLGQKVKNVATNIKQKVTNKVENVTTKIKAAPITEQVSKLTTMTKEFMEANSTISKFVAVVLSLLLFYILFNIGAAFITSFYTKSSPVVLNGLINSTSTKIIPSNPNVKNSVPILRSINKDQGLEFTWDLWFFIENMKPMINTNKYSLLFSKGTAGTPTPIVGAPLLTVCPGAYITYNGNKNSAELVVALNTFIDNPSEASSLITGNELIKIPKIPLSKWVHCAIRVQNKSVDIYINGVMTQRKNLLMLPKQNYYDTYIGDSNGFNGYISSLNYYDRALNYDEIQRDYIKGPNMKMADDNTSINYKDYLSMNWYYN